MIRLLRPSVWTVIAFGALLILTFTILYPLSSLFVASVTDPQTGGFSLAGYAAFFSTPDFVAALLNTLLLGLITTLGALVLGVGIAFVVARFDFPLKPLVGMLPLVTLVIPDVIVVQSWIMVFGNNGVVTNFFWDMFRLNTPRFYRFCRSYKWSFRPIADIASAVQLLRAQPSWPTYAARAKPEAGRTHSLRDKVNFRCTFAKVSSVVDCVLLCRSGLPTEATPYRSARTARPTKTKEIPISVCREKVSLPTMMFNTAIMTRLE